MLRAHRQAWAWQDEWFGLTMEDIREIERETQETLKKKMATPERELEEDEEGGGGGRRGSSSGSSTGAGEDSVMEASVLPSHAHPVRPHLNRTSHSAQSSTERSMEGGSAGSSEAHPVQVQISEATEKTIRLGSSPKDTPALSKGRSSLEAKGSHWSLSSAKLTLNSPGSSSANSFDLLATLRMESIMRRDSDSGSEEEFFDCVGALATK